MNKEQRYKLIELVGDLVAYLPILHNGWRFTMPNHFGLKRRAEDMESLFHEDFPLVYRMGLQTQLLCDCEDLIRKNGWEHVEAHLRKLTEIAKENHDPKNPNGAAYDFMKIHYRRLSLNGEEPHNASSG